MRVGAVGGDLRDGCHVPLITGGHGAQGESRL
jgi:hypothetical protein